MLAGKNLSAPHSVDSEIFSALHSQVIAACAVTLTAGNDLKEMKVALIKQRKPFMFGCFYFTVLIDMLLYEHTKGLSKPKNFTLTELFTDKESTKIDWSVWSSD